MKTEPNGNLKVTAEMVLRLGLEGLTEAQCQVASAMWMTKPVVPTEAALLVARIPIIQASKSVVCINTAPPGIRVRRINRRSQGVCLAPVDKYMARPADLQDMTLIE